MKNEEIIDKFAETVNPEKTSNTSEVQVEETKIEPTPTEDISESLN